MQIYSIHVKGVNLYLIDSGTHRLLIDSGFPGMTHELGRALRATGFKIRDIDYLIVTHFHVDHAGAVQELKEEGVKFVLFDVQVDHIAPMEKMIEGKWPYRTLGLKDNISLREDESRTFLMSLGIKGQVISTPGHSDDSITLLLDSGEAFTGDLMAAFLATDENSKESWFRLQNLGAKIIYPSHGKIYFNLNHMAHRKHRRNLCVLCPYVVNLLPSVIFKKIITFDLRIIREIKPFFTMYKQLN